MTDASAPSHNKVLIGTAAADVELLPLLNDRVIVENLQLLDVQFDQPRERPGKVYRAPTHSFSFDELKAEAKDAVPTVDELLARSALKSTQAVENAQAAYRQYSDSLKTDYDALPDSARLSYYKEQVDTLKNTDYKNPQALLQAKEKLETLKQDIARDREKVSRFTEQAKEAKTALSKSVNALKKAPGQDYDLLKGALTGDQASLNAITHMVFGDKAEQYSSYLMSAIQIVLPLINGDNTKSAPAEKDIPSILVKHADVSVKWKNETITSAWDNITNTHALVGQPTTFTIAGADELLKQFTSSGQFWIDAAGVDAEQNWSLSGIDLSDIDMVSDKKLNAALKQAILTTTGGFSVKDNQLNGTGSIDLSSLDLSAQGTNTLTTAIANALASLKELNMTLTLDGTVQNPGFRLKSDLDNKLAKSALTQLTASQQDKLDELNKKLNAMVAGQQQTGEKQLISVDSMLQAAQGDSEALEALLQTQLNNVVEDQKKKLFDKLKSKLGNGN